MVFNVITAIIAYLIGSVNFSVILSKKMAGFDVREKGSGNAGTTNMLRSVGKKAAALTLICDVLKGVVAILIAMFIGLKLFGFLGFFIGPLLVILFTTAREANIIRFNIKI